MKQPVLISALLGFVVIAVVSCQPSNQNILTEAKYHAEVKSRISELDKLFYEAWEKRDLDSTMSFLDDGFMNMFGFGPAQNKEECRISFEEVFEAYLVEGVEFKSVELIVDQNYAIETGLFKQLWITHDKQDTIRFDMRGMTVFRKQDDGGWKLYRLIAQQ